MKLSDKITIPAQVLARAVGDEIVILDLAGGTYYGLDEVGARIWQLLSQGLALGSACDSVFNEYAVARDMLEQDAVRLVEDLIAKGLVQLRENP